jgi:hypothetical protein
MKPVPIRRKRKTCAASKENGDPCTNAVLTPDGLQRLLDRGAALVPDASSYCSWHARTDSERRRMQGRGGTNSAKVVREKVVPELDVMPQDIVVKSYELIRTLITAKIPNVVPVEVDYKKAAVGVYLAALLCAQPEDRMTFAHQLLRNRTNRDDTFQVAEEELRHTIDQLDPDQRNATWELLNTA